MEHSNKLNKLNDLANNETFEIMGRIDKAKAVSRLLNCFVQGLDDVPFRIEIGDSIYAIETLLEDAENFTKKI